MLTASSKHGRRRRLGGSPRQGSRSGCQHDPRGKGTHPAAFPAGAGANAALQVSLTAGASSNTSCPGFLPAVPRIGFPGMCLGDAGNGLRATDFVSSWPSGIHVGASWNRGLTRQRGVAMGGEFRTKGVNVLLGPVVGPMGRVVLSGRNWEGRSLVNVMTACALNVGRVLDRSVPGGRLGV